MIEAKNISKSFDDIKAVDGVSIEIKDGEVFGLIGTNGAGKSTFLRMMAGVIKPDEGEILIDGIPVYENVEAKGKVFYISDEQFFFASATPVDMVRSYETFYPNFDKVRFLELIDKFSLDKNRKINTFSKGMKKQLSILLGLCAGTKYLYCDETFDGLDPVMRQAVKSLFAGEMADRDFTPIIASHNLRELEDICDHVGLLHKGGVILSKDLGEMKESIHKIQCVLSEGTDEQELLKDIDLISIDRRGSLLTVTARGDKDVILNTFNKANPIFIEALPLSLEEIFISETGVIGYDIKKLIF